LLSWRLVGEYSELTGDGMLIFVSTDRRTSRLFAPVTNLVAPEVFTATLAAKPPVQLAADFVNRYLI
jgi:hypothetical protein